MNQLQSETNVCGVNTIEDSFSSMKLLCKEKKTSLFQYFENSEESKNDIYSRYFHKN